MQLVPKMVLFPGRTPYSQPKLGQRAIRTEQAVQPRGTRWQHMCHERAGLEHPGTDVWDGEAWPPPGSIFWEHGGPRDSGTGSPVLITMVTACAGAWLSSFGDSLGFKRRSGVSAAAVRRPKH